jgi:origin recognition complex subunit 1
MIRINFKPYSSAQLEQIVKSRLANAKEGLKSGNDKDVIAPDGIKFAAMKVSSITGDARRVLDICRSVSFDPRPLLGLILCI